MKTRLLPFIVAAMAAVGPACAADSPVTLRFAHWVPPQHILPTKAFAPWAESIEKDSGGSIKVQFYPAAQLGKPADHYDLAARGIADIAFVNPGYQPGRFPIMEAVPLPLLMSNGREGSAAIDEWYASYADEEMPDVHLCLVHGHDPAPWHSTFELRLPSDLEGRKIRTPNSAVAAYVNTIGAVAVQVPAGEVREVFERGLVDAAPFPWQSLLDFGAAKFTPYHYDLPFYSSALAFVMNKASYERLSPDQKKVMDDHCSPEWAKFVATVWSEAEDAGKPGVAALEGAKIIEPTEKDVAAWKASTAEVYQQWADEVSKKGGDPDAILDGLKSALRKHNSLFE